MLACSSCAQARKVALQWFWTNLSSTEKAAGTFGNIKVDSLVGAVRDTVQLIMLAVLGVREICPRGYRNMLSSSTATYRMNGDIKHVYHLGPRSHWQGAAERACGRMQQLQP